MSFFSETVVHFASSDYLNYSGRWSLLRNGIDTESVAIVFGRKLETKQTDNLMAAEGCNEITLSNSMATGYLQSIRQAATHPEIEMR